VKFSAWPTAIVGFVGTISIDAGTGPVTVSVEGGEVIPLSVAVIFEVPVMIVLARPPAEIVATP